MILGQDKICSKINSLTLDTFPRSLMLVGPSGSGKHLIADHISKRFGLQLIDITDSLNQKFIEELYTRAEPYIYIIEANKISVKEEFAILKFLEEPLKNAFIILLAETEIGLLNTITNRCQIWHLQNYSKETLKQFIEGTNELVLSVASTPGQVKALCNAPFAEMIELADKIIDKIHVAGVANTLTISNKIAFKDSEKGKFDLRLFVSILQERFVSRYKLQQNTSLFEGYILTKELKSHIEMKNLDYRALFEGYLIKLRAVMQKGTS